MRSDSDSGARELRVAFREAGPKDADRVAELVAGDPSQESISLCGDRARAREFGMALARSSVIEGRVWTFVGELNGQVVVVLQMTEGVGELRVTADMVASALRVFGPLGVLQLLFRARGRARVESRPPADTLHISELHVLRDLRRRGIGREALRFAEAQARARGRRVLSLTTTTINPARRLYERSGFSVVETRTNPVYRRITGIDGRHLMVKELNPDSDALGEPGV